MKKSILIFCTVLVTFSLMAFGYMNRGNTVTAQEETSSTKTAIFNNDFLYPINPQADSDLFYKVDSRFIATITKEKLHNATSIIDILPEKATKSRESYQNARVSILGNDSETTELGESDVLNPAQLELLQSTDYSTNIRVTSIGREKHKLVDDSLVYYLTVIPEQEAKFSGGHDALIKYLKENSKEKTGIIQQDQLKPGKVNFTVTKNGRIANVELSSTSGYPSVDKALVELITNMPEKWNPATNSKGEKVDQELVFFFGMEGC
jgi:TonB family protein